MPISKHTPGPWSVEQDTSNNGDIDVFAADFLPIASVDVREHPDDTISVPREVALDNARLIAAAPDLLAACKEAFIALPMTKHNESINEKLKAAIAKAEAAQ